MNLYYLYSLARAEGDRVTVSDRQNRIAGYFIWNTNDGKFLNFTTVQGVAQAYLVESEILKADYLDCVISVPIFSARAREVFETKIPGEMEFHEISISAGEKKFEFFLAKCHKRASILNKDASEYRPLTDGSPILSLPVGRKNLDDEFYIARDCDEPQVLAVSQKFVDLCSDNDLNVGFLEMPQA